MASKKTNILLIIVIVIIMNLAWPYLEILYYHIFPALFLVKILVHLFEILAH